MLHHTCGKILTDEGDTDPQVNGGDPLLDRTLYYNAFETIESVAAEQAAGDDAVKIVVFIDDLDRCLPPQALKLLESIKLVLAQRGFIFALAGPIYAGTNEVQRNIIAERILGLPRK